MRGISGIDPQDTGDQLGGELFSGACARVTYQPSGNPTGLGFHGFLNAANVVSLQGSSSLPGLNEWVHGHRLSAGVGLILPVQGFRAELNLVQPLVHKPSDTTQRMQLGLGINFL